MSRHARMAIAAGVLAVAMVAADELLNIGSIGYAGIFVMGMAVGIWIGGDIKPSEPA